MNEFSILFYVNKDIHACGRAVTSNSAWLLSHSWIGVRVCDCEGLVVWLVRCVEQFTIALGVKVMVDPVEGGGMGHADDRGRTQENEKKMGGMENDDTIRRGGKEGGQRG